jgi:hypothetical protein
MVSAEQSDERVRAYQDGDGVPALVDPRGRAQKCALVIAPTDRGMHVCVVTEAGEEAYWEELNAARWRDQVDTLGPVPVWMAVVLKEHCCV